MHGHRGVQSGVHQRLVADHGGIDFRPDGQISQRDHGTDEHHPPRHFFDAATRQRDGHGDFTAFDIRLSPFLRVDVSVDPQAIDAHDLHHRIAG